MKEIVIIGSGGFAKEVSFLIKDINRNHNEWNVLGFIDLNIGREIVDNLKVIGNDEWVVNSSKELYVAIGIGNPSLISSISKKYNKNPLIKFPNLIHPNVTGDWENIKMGKGNIFCSGVRLTTDIKIGSNNIFNLNTTIGHDVKIGSANVFNPSVNISGDVSILSQSLIGTGAQILQGVSFNSNEITVGASALASRDLEDSGVYVGIPARRKS
ncbi:transferase [Ekhidna sp.]|uniref:PglD-related sugar-binding protein n=1 Tax=Ekhidna sp. TaxID=2608089 RepID=UPI003299E340